MNVVGDTVSFKSVHPYFGWERDGAKANTVRVVPAEAVHRLCHCKVITITAPNGEAFTRRLSNVTNITGVMEDSGVTVAEGYRLVSLSWGPDPDYKTALQRLDALEDHVLLQAEESDDLKAALARAAGLVSTIPPYTDKHPEEVLAMLLQAAETEDGQ